MSAYGSFCSGIGGLDLAVEETFGYEPAWHSEINPDALAVHDRHWPGLPNLGDLTAVDWTSVPEVDLICAGYPCQPFSHAGARRGENDERHLWPYLAEAVRVLRPRWVVLENVAGHLSLGFGAVVGDLAEAGYDAEWVSVRASDVGAPHRRERVFILATDASGAGAGRHAGGAPDAEEPDRRGAPHEGHTPGADGADAPDADVSESGSGHHPGARSLADTDRAGSEARRGSGRRLSGQQGRVELVGSRAAADADTTGDTGRLCDGDGEDAADAHGTRRRPARDAGPGDPVGTGTHRQPERRHREGPAWGDYEPAIRRWEHILGRPSPDPVDERGQLSPPFVEWMMGYPAGWVGGLTHTAALRCLGNAVVPPQGVAALSLLLDAWETAA